MRIVEDKLTKTPKGFGYVEFSTVDGLKKALDLSGTTVQGRAIRTSIAEPRKCLRKQVVMGDSSLADKLCSQGSPGCQGL